MTRLIFVGPSVQMYFWVKSLSSKVSNVQMQKAILELLFASWEQDLDAASSHTLAVQLLSGLWILFSGRVPSCWRTDIPDLENKFLKPRGEFQAVFLRASVRSCPPSAPHSIYSGDVHLLFFIISFVGCLVCLNETLGGWKGIPANLLKGL